MTTLDECGVDGATPVREAACLVLIDRSEDEARLLMGRRLPSQVFLPNKWVFPGGRVDDADHARAAGCSGTTAAGIHDAAHLPFLVAALRETYEEAGLAINNAQGASLTLDQAELSNLIPLARAITPPGLRRRFDTWFYLADWDRNRLPSGTPDGELTDLGWFTIPEVRALDVPLITRLIVDDVAIAAAGPRDSRPALVPFYFQAVEGYKRTLISPSWPWPQP